VAVSTFNVIFPILAIALLGYALARSRLFGGADIAGLSRYVFDVGVPALLFDALANLDLPAVIDWRYLLAYYAAAFTIYAIGMLVSRLGFAHSLPEQGVFGMAASYSNTLLVGLPVALGAFGQAALLPMLLIIALHSGLLSLTVTVIAEAASGRGARRRAVVSMVARRMIANPITLGVVIGLAFNWLGWSLPGPLAEVVSLLAQSVMPCALFSLGASLTQYRLANYSLEAWVLVGLKLCLHPLLAWLVLSRVFHIQGLWAAVAVITAGSPIGVNVSVFAQKYQAGIAPVAAATLLSSVLGVVSLSVLLVLLA
jgi:predicted permease